jgi:hypothetical protein
MSNKYCAIAVDRLRPDNKAAFMALASSHKEDGSGPVVGIVRTNGIAMNLDPEEMSESEIYSAICKDISRLNHRQVRNKEFKPYGFICTCPACIDAPASDARRATTIKRDCPERSPVGDGRP